MFMAVFAAVGAVMSFMGNKSAAKAQSIINKANADAENLVRRANNEREVAVTALNASLRSIRNQQIMKAAGDNYNALAQNIARVEADTIRGKFEQRLAASEQMGALTASSASAGVAGSTVEMIESTMRLRNQRMEAEADTASTFQIGDMEENKFRIIENAVGSMDSSMDIANLDYSRSIPAFVAKPSILQGVLGVAQAVAPYANLMFRNNQMQEQQQQTTSRSLFRTNSGANLNI